MRDSLLQRLVPRSVRPAGGLVRYLLQVRIRPGSCRVGHAPGLPRSRRHRRSHYGPGVPLCTGYPVLHFHWRQSDGFGPSGQSLRYRSLCLDPQNRPGPPCPCHGYGQCRPGRPNRFPCRTGRWPGYQIGQRNSPRRSPGSGNTSRHSLGPAANQRRCCGSGQGATPIPRKDHAACPSTG